MRKQSSIVRVSAQKNRDSDRKKHSMNCLSNKKDIQLTEQNPLDNNFTNYHQRGQSVIKQHIQDPNVYQWQDFLTIFQYTSEQRQKLNFLLPKGFSFIPKQEIPENIKTQLSHYARRMNLKIEYEKKEAQQAQKNPAYQIQFDPFNFKQLQPQQTAFQPQQSRVEQSNKLQEKLNKREDFSDLNKVVLKLKKGQKMVDDLSVYAHPIYQKMHNIVIFKRMLHPVNFAKQNEKQIKKQREIQRIRKIKEERMAKLQKIDEKEKEGKIKTIESHKNVMKNRTIYMSKKSPKNKLSLQNPKMNLQLIAIKELMEKLQKHQHFQILLQANTTPTIKCLLKILKSKIQRNYNIHQFERDLLRIFKVYFKTSKEKITMVRNVKNYQKFMKNAIENQKIIFPNQYNQNIKKQPQSKLVNTINAKPKNKSLQNLLRNKPKEDEIQRLQKLGKNVCRLDQENAEQFCIEFCNDQCEKQEGDSFIFQLDFNKENTSRLMDMENFVKQKLDVQKSVYVALSDEDISQQFVIENDYDD